MINKRGRMIFFKSKKHKKALAIGLFVAILHLIWAVVVGLGSGQKSLDWLLTQYFVSNLFAVLPFTFLKAFFLVIATFIAGYAFAWLYMGIKRLTGIK